MAERKRYDVQPTGDGDWAVKLRGASRASAVCENKTDAVARAKELAKDAPLGQVIIRDQHNKIQTEHTYGNDPRRRKG